jgi:urocanate hydratase
MASNPDAGIVTGMTPTLAVRQIVRIVADGTGRSPEEVWTLLAATMAVTVARAAARGALRVVDYATESDVGPSPARQSGRAGHE